MTTSITARAEDDFIVALTEANKTRDVDLVLVLRERPDARGDLIDQVAELLGDLAAHAADGNDVGPRN